MSIYDFTVTNEQGESYPLSRYQGQPLIIVNTATKCGLSLQFKDLQTLYDTYKDQGLMILGFPSDQFKQELSSAGEAAALMGLISRCTNLPSSTANRPIHYFSISKKKHQVH